MKREIMAMTIEGDPTKGRVRIFELDQDGDPIKCVAEYDSLAAAVAYKWRTAKQYKISVGRFWLSKAQFLEWAKRHQRPDLDPVHEDPKFLRWLKRLEPYDELVVRMALRHNIRDPGVSLQWEARIKALEHTLIKNEDDMAALLHAVDRARARD
jgi:hypothetical protein